jgi:hypothetical protein
MICGILLHLSLHVVAYSYSIGRIKLRSCPIGRGWEVLIVGQLWSLWRTEDPPRPSFAYRDTAGPTPDSLQENFLEEVALHGVEAEDNDMNMRVVAQAAGTYTRQSFFSLWP